MKKVQLLNFGRLSPRQFSLDLKKKSDLGYFYLYLQHILGVSKSGKLDDPLMSLSNKRDMHDSLQLSWHLMFFKLFVVDFKIKNGGFGTDFLPVPLNSIIPDQR